MINLLYLYMAFNSYKPSYFIMFNKNSTDKHVISASNVTQVAGSNYCKGVISSVTAGSEKKSNDEVGIVFARRQNQSCNLAFETTEYFLVRGCLDVESTLRFAEKIEAASVKLDQKNLINYISCDNSNLKITIKKKFGPIIEANVNFVDQAFGNIRVFETVIDPIVGWKKKRISREEAFKILESKEPLKKVPEPITPNTRW